MSKTTRATQALEKLGVKFTVHLYEYDPDAESIGLQAAEALGVEPQRVLKTLMAEVDGKPVCVVVPSDSEVSMNNLPQSVRLARAARNDAPGRCRTAHRLSMSAASVRSARKSACRSQSKQRRSAIPAYSSTVGSAACRSNSIPNDAMEGCCGDPRRLERCARLRQR